ncbi:hypothetical protein RchiOBHm_Chr4g0398481 [Rosa chinensis]|uniref:Uncharacterized protein n=1 Tax=Rosa chinensis TaxID=74649 RepID=A0A2P6QSA7_ROSCH|nr:hypothetical protein RchiOBHm_Chr4g0398481 [Rosa chinensis]
MFIPACVTDLGEEKEGDSGGNGRRIHNESERSNFPKTKGPGTKESEEFKTAFGPPLTKDSECEAENLKEGHQVAGSHTKLMVSYEVRSRTMMYWRMLLMERRAH